MEYQLQIPPFAIGAFESLSARQAKEIFQWYVNDIPYRLKLLQSFLDEECGTQISLTKGEETLKPLWEWFIGTIQTRERTEAELQNELKVLPAWLHSSIRADSKKLTIETLTVGMDIAIYLAEVLVKNHSEIHWDYFTKPKSRVSVNEPVLLGFVRGVEMNPRHVVNTLMWRFVERKENCGLLEIYQKWVEMIEEKRLV